MEDLAESTLTLEADAPQDSDAVRFLDRLLSSLPGRAQIQQLSLDRLGAESNAPLAATNIRLHAVIGWLANASRKENGS